MPETEFEAVIGLETHVQLSTNSKMFSWSGAGYQKASPNTLVDPVSMALPGTLPVVNKRAVESAIAIGLALNCEIAEVTKFDRKQYTYPDLMKGYQISQYDEPICIDGWLDLPTETPHRVGINRVHMEEDVARLIHIDSPTGGVMHSLLDINRAGVPLMEIVTEPDMRTPDQVEAYIKHVAIDHPLPRRRYRQHGRRLVPLRCEHQRTSSRFDNTRRESRSKEHEPCPSRS